MRGIRIGRRDLAATRDNLTLDRVRHRAGDVGLQDGESEEIFGDLAQLDGQSADA